MMAYDPRDAQQDPSDESTWKETENPVLIAASILWLENRDVDWTRVKYMADYCEELE